MKTDLIVFQEEYKDSRIGLGRFFDDIKYFLMPEKNPLAALIPKDEKGKFVVQVRYVSDE